MSRSHYWSCSKFADWVRGTPKLGAGTAEQWNEWDSKAKRYNPIRYWLAEEGLDYVSNIVYFIPDTLYSIKYYINNRWVTRTHSLTAHPRDIKPGQWHDVGNRFLPCLFNELVDFVEIESAWSHIAWGSEEDKAKYKAPFWASGWFRWRTWRCPQAGIDHLDWAMTLVMDDNMGVEKDSPNYGKPTGQAERAKEIKELYTWWTVTRPARPDPYEASGWTAVCEASRLANGGKFNWGGREKDPVLKKQSDKAHKLLQKMETAYEKEDEDMMIRLIKVRDSLWT
jgi:hypothetical protein